MAKNMRPQVVQLYKNLLFMGKDYPKGYEYFREKTKAAFLKNKDVSDPEMIRVLVAKGKYVMKELDALYKLKKYRTLKQRYYEPLESLESLASTSTQVTESNETKDSGDRKQSWLIILMINIIICIVVIVNRKHLVWKEMWHAINLLNLLTFALVTVTQEPVA